MLVLSIVNRPPVARSLEKLVNTEAENVDQQIVVLALLLLLLLLVLVALVVATLVVALVLLLLVVGLLLHSGLLVHLARLLGTVGQLNDHDASVLGVNVVSQVVLIAQLLHGRLDFGHASGRVQALAHNSLDHGVASLHGRLEPLAQKILGLLDVQAVEIDFVVCRVRVVFSKHVLGGLLVVLVHLLTVFLGLLAQLLGCRTVAALVRLLALVRQVLAPLVLFVGQVSEPFVLSIRGVVSSCC